uniref:Uncharacterized protein n=1 Tax=Siphoviridae sp. ctM4S20 TaxID=2825458 RepID=A0A8S5P740_9CAUD|nr:MAG TPA: hypothetical protein [Siphoviridae sp. ctM4S20]
MIKAKLFKSKNIRGEWVTAAEQLEDFINSNLSLGYTQKPHNSSSFLTRWIDER